MGRGLLRRPSLQRLDHFPRDPPHRNGLVLSETFPLTYREKVIYNLYIHTFLFFFSFSFTHPIRCSSPFLAARIVAVVIPLQVLANLSTAYLDETMPGVSLWLTTGDLLHVFDVLCCCAVLVPLGWSIRQLQEAAAEDSRAARTYTKVRLFTRFYSAVWAYIYFSRIVV